MDAPHIQKVSWSDYQTWSDDERWEIIDGFPYAMSAPRVSHQAVIGNLFLLIGTFFRGKTCRAFLSPIDVRLSEYNAVQPDLVVVCRPEIVTQTHIDGPPTLVVEVLSPSTQRHDRVRKLRLYASFGIEEYWLIQPSPALVEVLSLDGDTYRVAASYTEVDTLKSPRFPELILPLSEVFEGVLEEPIDEVRETPPPYPHRAPSESLSVGVRAASTSS